MEIVVRITLVFPERKKREENVHSRSIVVRRVILVIQVEVDVFIISLEEDLHFPSNRFVRMARLAVLSIPRVVRMVKRRTTIPVVPILK